MDNFKFLIPAEIEKSADGEWRIRGLASTAKRDQQGEVLIQKGMDLTPIDKKQGYFNFDHQPGPENLVGIIDGYNKTDNGLYVEGRLFKNHTKAKAIHEIMSSLGKSDKGRVGLSVEGKILERDSQNPKIIKKCQIKNVAITMNPVNADTYADLVKSLTAGDIEFAANEANLPVAPLDFSGAPTFTSDQVISLIKTLGVGNAGATVAPGQRSGGDALAQEELDRKPKKLEMPHDINKLNDEPKKNLRKMSKALYKSTMGDLLNKIQMLYPNSSRSELWEAVKDRLHKKFPDLDHSST